MSGLESQSQSQHVRGALRYKTESESNSVIQPQVKRATTKAASMLLGFAPSIGVKFHDDVENVPVMATPSALLAVTPGYDLSPEEAIIRRKYLAGSTPHAAKDLGDDENGVNGNSSHISSAFKSVLELKKHNYEFNITRPSPMVAKETKSNTATGSTTSYFSPHAVSTEVAESTGRNSAQQEYNDSTADTVCDRQPSNVTMKSSPEIIVQKELFSNTMYGDSPQTAIGQSISLEMCLGLGEGDSCQSTPAASPLTINSRAINSRAATRSYSSLAATPHQSTFSPANPSQTLPESTCGLVSAMPIRRSSPVTAPSPPLFLGGQDLSPTNEVLQRFRECTTLRNSTDRTSSGATPYRPQDGDMSVKGLGLGLVKGVAASSSAAAINSSSNVALAATSKSRGFVPSNYNAMERTTGTRASVGVSLSKPGLSLRGGRVPTSLSTFREDPDMGISQPSLATNRRSAGQTVESLNNKDIGGRTAIDKPIAVAAAPILLPENARRTIVPSHKVDLDSSDSSHEDARKSVRKSHTRDSIFTFGGSDIDGSTNDDDDDDDENDERGLADIAGYTAPVKEKKAVAMQPPKHAQSLASLLSYQISNKVSIGNDVSRCNEEEEEEFCNNDEEVDRNTELNSSSVFDPNASAMFTVATEISIDSNFSLAADGEKVPKFVIASRKISKECNDNMKEITLVASPGGYSTISLTFGNEKDRRIRMRPKALQMRFDPVSKTKNSALDFDNNAAFEVSPRLLDIPIGSERTMYVTFSPRAGLCGIYSGALKVKTGKKTFVLLLRGEAIDDSSDSSKDDIDGYQDSRQDAPEPSKESVSHVGTSGKIDDLDSKFMSAYSQGIGSYAIRKNRFAAYPTEPPLESDALRGSYSSTSGLEHLLGGRDASGNFQRKNPYAIGSFPISADVFSSNHHNNYPSSSNDYQLMRRSSDQARSSFENRPITMMPTQSSFEHQQVVPSMIPARRFHENVNVDTRPLYEGGECIRRSLDKILHGNTTTSSVDEGRAALVVNDDIIKTHQRLRTWLNTEKTKSIDSDARPALKEQKIVSNGIFFRKDSTDYGHVPVGSLSRAKMELCNATDEVSG